MKILDIFKASTVEAVGSIVDKVVTNNGEKSQLKNELTSVVLAGLNKVTDAQAEVIKTEMKGNFLQRSWRPIMMLTFGVILVCKWFGLTDSDIEISLEVQLLEIVKLGLGGYVVGRSVEKVATTVTKNIDLPFLKRKNRAA